MTDCVTRWRFQKSQLKRWDQCRDVNAQYELHSVWTQSHRCLELTRKSLGMKSDRQARSSGSTAWTLQAVFVFLNKLQKQKSLQVKHFMWNANLYLTVVPLFRSLCFSKLLVILIILQLPSS